MLVADTQFDLTEGGIMRLDQKKRLSIGPVLRKGEASYFQLYRNRSGQILLNPIVPLEAANAPLLTQINALTDTILDTKKVQLAKKATSQELVNEAVKRGCRHYAAFATKTPENKALSDIPSEIVACTLLQGELPEAFDQIRIGAMLLSAAENNPFVIWLAALCLNVGGRVRSIAEFAVEHDTNPNWRLLLPLLPNAPEEGMPGLSRLTVETALPKRTRTWLKPVANLR